MSAVGRVATTVNGQAGVFLDHSERGLLAVGVDQERAARPGGSPAAR